MEGRGSVRAVVRASRGRRAAQAELRPTDNPRKIRIGREFHLTLVRFLIIRCINFMRGTLTLLKGLPRYEVFLEEAKHFPGLPWAPPRSIQPPNDRHEMYRGPSCYSGGPGEKNRGNSRHHLGLAGWI